MLASTNLYFCKDLISFAYLRGDENLTKRIFCSIISTSYAKSKKLCNRLTTSLVGTTHVGAYTSKLLQPELHPNAKSLSMMDLLNLGANSIVGTPNSQYYLACNSSSPLLPEQKNDYTDYLKQLTKANSPVLFPLTDNLLGGPYLMQRVNEAKQLRELTRRAIDTAKSVAKTAVQCSNNVTQALAKAPNITINNIVECPMEDIKKTLAIGMQTCKCNCQYDLSNPLRTVIVAALLLTALVLVFSRLNNHATNSETNTHTQISRKR